MARVTFQSLHLVTFNNAQKQTSAQPVNTKTVILAPVNHVLITLSVQRELLHVQSVTLEECQTRLKLCVVSRSYQKSFLFDLYISNRNRLTII